jgi:hypothetical protein
LPVPLRSNLHPSCPFLHSLHSLPSFLTGPLPLTNIHPVLSFISFLSVCLLS